MKASKKLVFFGTDDFSGASLEKLLSSGWDVSTVVAKPDFKAGRGQTLTKPTVKRIAEKNSVDVLQPEKLGDIASKIKSKKPDFGILAAYGKIIPPDILDLFPGGIINVHPSLLPRYRGASPIEAAILGGDKQTGVSLMRLSEGLDEGPVYAQEVVKLSGDENQIELSERLGDIGADLLVEKLEAIAEGWLTPKPQFDPEATYTKLLKKEDGVMDLGQPAEVLERQVRALAGWPKSRTKIHAQDVIVTKARVAKGQEDGVLVIKCTPGYLEIQELVGPSGKTMSGADFLRGYRK